MRHTHSRSHSHCPLLGTGYRIWTIDTVVFGGTAVFHLRPHHSGVFRLSLSLVCTTYTKAAAGAGAKLESIIFIYDDACRSHLLNE